MNTTSSKAYPLLQFCEDVAPGVSPPPCHVKLFADASCCAWARGVLQQMGVGGTFRHLNTQPHTCCAAAGH